MVDVIYRPRITKRVGAALQPLAYDTDANGANGIEVEGSSWSNNANGTIGNQSGTKHGGYSFESVTIAQGATVTYAEFALPTISAKTGSPTLVLFVEDADNPTVLSTSRRPSAVSSALGPYDASGVTVGANSLNVTAWIQAIVNRAGWASGNRINFMLYDNGSSTNHYISVSQGSSKAHLKIFGG